MKIIKQVREGVADLNLVSAGGLFAFSVLWYASRIYELTPNRAIAIFGINFGACIVGLIIIEHLYNFILNSYDSSL